MNAPTISKAADTLHTVVRCYRLSIADGAKGLRMYDWAAGRYGEPTDHGLVHWLLIRRSLDESHERAYYLCTAPPEATMQDLAIAAGQRWSIECCFESAKQETGAGERNHGTRTGNQSAPDLVPLTEPEVRRLLLAIVWPKMTSIERALIWSTWRRRHQALAKRCHYQARKRKLDAQL